MNMCVCAKVFVCVYFFCLFCFCLLRVGYNILLPFLPRFLKKTTLNFVQITHNSKAQTKPTHSIASQKCPY